MQGRLGMLAQLLCILELMEIQTRHLTSPRHNRYVKWPHQHICFIYCGAAKVLAHADASPVAMHRALKMTEDYGACCAQVVRLNCMTYLTYAARAPSVSAEYCLSQPALCSQPASQ